MVIQRIQTLYLLIAVLVMTIFLFVPFGYAEFSESGNVILDEWLPLDVVWMLVPVCAAVFLMVAGIFLFKSLAAQKLVVIFSLLLTLVSIGEVIYFIQAGGAGIVDANAAMNAGKATWGWGIILPICAAVFQIAALRGISSDRRLLDSYNRLR